MLRILLLATILCLNQMVKTAAAPDVCWPKIKTRILYAAESYGKARNKLRRAEETSDLTTDMSDSGKRKRKNTIQDVNFGRCLPNLPTMPISDSDSETDEININKSKNHFPQDLEEHPTTPKSSTSKQVVPNSGVQNLTANEKFQRKVFTFLEEIKAELKEQKEMLHSLLPKNFSSHHLPANSPELPAQAPEGLMELDNYLENNDNLMQMCNFFRCVGGATVRDVTRRILQSLLTNKLSCSYNWKGSGGVKLGFSAFRNILNMISTSVRQGKFQNTTNYKIESCIKR